MLPVPVASAAADTGLRAIFRRPDVFIATALQRGWFPDGVVRELIRVIAAYVCTFGMYLSL